MRRVVVTGMGIVSSLGNNQAEVLDSLKNGRSGITFQQEYADRGMRSHVAGSVKIDYESMIDRKLSRFMGPAHAYAWIAMQEAIAQSGLTPDQVSNVRTGLIAGAGGTSSCRGHLLHLSQAPFGECHGAWRQAFGGFCPTLA